MRKYTVDDIMAMGPCERYPVERVEELWGGKESLSLKEIFELDIPSKDKVWVATRPYVLPRNMLVRFAWACAWNAANYAMAWGMSCNVAVREARLAEAGLSAAARAEAIAARAADLSDVTDVERERQIQYLLAALEAEAIP